MYRNKRYEIVLRIQFNEVREFLEPAQSQRYAVADQHSPEDNPGSDMQEHLGYGLVGHSQGFERADCGDVPEQHYQKSGDHVESGDNGHQDKDEQDIEVNEIQPVEDLRITADHRGGDQGVVILSGLVKRYVADLFGDGTHSGVGPGSRSQCKFQNGSLVGSPPVKSLKVRDVRKHNDVVCSVHDTFIKTGYVEIADLDFLPYKVSQEFVADIETEHFREPDRNRDSELYRVGFGFLTWRSFEEHPVDALPFLDDSRAIDSRSDLLNLRNRLDVRHKTLVDRDRGELADVVHVHRHQLHVTRKVGDAVPDLVSESRRDGDGDNHDEERDSDGDHRYPSSETEASGYEP